MTTIFKQLNPDPCRTYLVVSESNREGALIDPLLDRTEDYLRIIRQEGVNLAYIIDTHTHADHLSAGAALCDHLQIPYVMHDVARPACVSHRVKDGDRLRIGDLTITCRHTPGHTNDSLTLFVDNRLLTGDFLFIGEGGAGRTDLPTGDPGEHFDSLLKLREFTDDALIYPAHDYHGKTHSTLGEERRTNPRLQFSSRDQYVRWLTNLSLPAVDWMIEVVNANYACTRDPLAVTIPKEMPSCEVGGTKAVLECASVNTITAEEARRRIEENSSGVAVLDVRRPDEYVGELGHIPGSLLIPLQELSDRIHEIAQYKETQIITVCRSGARSRRAAGILMDAGYANISSMDGGMLRWNDLGFPKSKGKS